MIIPLPINMHIIRATRRKLIVILHIPFAYAIRPTSYFWSIGIVVGPRYSRALNHNHV